MVTENGPALELLNGWKRHPKEAGSQNRRCRERGLLFGETGRDQCEDDEVGGEGLAFELRRERDIGAGA